ncbi:MAG: transcription elongation factor GreA [Tissierellia bacterium]|nr:transcription elongation factor GreA [Tissierellia bacterium]
MEKDVFVTADGLKKLESDLEYLKSVRRREVAERIKIALGYGDLSENAEYDQAKNEQAQLEEKIAKTEMMLRNAKLIDDENFDKNIVSVGSKVKLRDEENGDEEEFTIVGSAEANPFEGIISNESPIGSGLLGKKLGDIAEIEVPSGILRYQILNISR